MKKLFLAALAVVTLASCSKEAADVNPENGDVVNAKMKISFVSSETKALVSNSDDLAVISDASVFVVNSGGGFQKKIYISGSDINSNKEYEITTAAKQVIVISNAGDLTGLNAGTVSQLEKEYGEIVKLLLDAESNPARIWMSGTESVAFTGTASDGTSKLATVDMQLSIVPARIDVKVTNNMANYGASNALVIDGVAVLYSAAYTSYLEPFKVNEYAAPGSYYRSGVDAWTAPLWDTHTAKDEYLAELNKGWDGNGGAFADTFYALPGAGVDSKNAILTIHATFNGEKHFFPVIFSNEEIAKDGVTANEILENGHRYQLDITLSGNASNGGGSTTDPETPVVKAYMTVKVTPKDWITHPVFDKEFK